MTQTNQYEEPWNDVIEDYLHKAKLSCQQHALLNNDAGYYYKRNKVRWGLPVVLIPVIMSPVSLMIGWAYKDSESVITPADYVNSIGYLISGLVSGVYTFFDYGQIVNDHFNVSLLFDNIIADIELELTKGREYRVQADLYLTRISHKIAEALRLEPAIPDSVLKKNNTTEAAVRKRTKIMYDIKIFESSDKDRDIKEAVGPTDSSPSADDLHRGNPESIKALRSAQLDRINSESPPPLPPPFITETSERCIGIGPNKDVVLNVKSRGE